MYRLSPAFTAFLTVLLLAGLFGALFLNTFLR